MGERLATLLTLLSAAAPLALMLALGVLAQISRRFGEVMRRPPLYRLYYAALALLSVPLGVRLLAAGFSAQQQARLGGHSAGALLYAVPLLLAIVLALGVTWWYWGWLVVGSEGPAATPPPRAPKAQENARS